MKILFTFFQTQAPKTDGPRQKRKFSTYFKSLVIELDRELYGPDNHLVEVSSALKEEICQQSKLSRDKCNLNVKGAKTSSGQRTFEGAASKDNGIGCQCRLRK